MSSPPQVAKPAADEPLIRGFERHYRIAEIAKLLNVSRATVYNVLRGETIVDLAVRGGKGVKLVPESTLRRILERKKKKFR